MVKKIQKVYKYGTGQDVPEGSKYLATVVDTHTGEYYVWHYFLVEVEKEEVKSIH